MSAARRASRLFGLQQYTASYTVANGLLIVRDRPRSTMMACAPGNMGLERDFLASMTRITASSVDNANNPQRMTWVLDTGDRLDFGRRTDPIAGGQQGPTKLVYVNAEKVPCSTSAGRAMCYQVRDSAGQPWQPWQGNHRLPVPAGHPLSAARGSSSRIRIRGGPVVRPLGAGRRGRAGNRLWLSAVMAGWGRRRGERFVLRVSRPLYAVFP